MSTNVVVRRFLTPIAISLVVENELNFHPEVINTRSVFSCFFSPRGELS